MPATDKSIYISYSWRTEKKNGLVEKLLPLFAEQGIAVKRDLREIKYGDSIREYMDTLASGEAIILVLSAAYFKSSNCMYELREIYLNNRKNFRQRIFPIVVQGTRFHRAADRIPYIRFWEEETKELETALASVARENIGGSSHQELRDYAAFRNMIDDLQSLIGDMNHLTEADHLKEEFSSLIKRIFPDPAPADDNDRNTDDLKEKSSPPHQAGRRIMGNNFDSSDGDMNIAKDQGKVETHHTTINNFYSSDREDPTGSQVETASSHDTEVKLGTLFGVPDLPPCYLERPDDLDAFRTVLLYGESQTVGIIGKRQYIGVQGMGGLGKSVLAAALANDKEARRTFPDGIFWLRFGKEIDEAGLLELQKEILLVLAPDTLPESPAQGRNLLTFALQGKRCLLIADDLWDSRQLNHFDLADSDCRFLLTTRDAEVIKKIGAIPCELHLLSDKQARSLLATCSGCTEETLPEEAAAILRECGRLPLAVAAIGSMVNGQGRNRWQLALKKLENARLDKIPANLTLDYDYENLFKVFQVSVEDLPIEVQAYYKTLLVFPEDAEIHESVLQLYWEHCRQGDYEPLDAVDLLVRRSLLSPVGKESFTLHDLLRDYLVFQAEDDVAELHKQLLAAYAAEYPEGWHTIPYEAPFYFFGNWIFHVNQADDVALASIIAEALIWQQPRLHLVALLNALDFVDYELEEIAEDLLKFHQDGFTIDTCNKIVADKKSEEAHSHLKEREKNLLACLDQLSSWEDNILYSQLPEIAQWKKEWHSRKKK